MPSYWDEIVVPLYIGDIQVDMVITDWKYTPAEPTVYPTMDDPGNPGTGAKFEVLEWHVEFPESISGVHIMCTQQMKESHKLAEKIHSNKVQWEQDFIERAKEHLKWWNAE